MRKTKGFAVGLLAVLMCGTALFGVACTPATSATQGTLGASSGTDGGGNPTTSTSPFGLNPETDPVVYTTESGLEIKCSNALTNTNLARYTYFTMGEYEGTPVNWVIIGYDPSVSDYVGEYSGEVSQADPIQGGHSFDSTVDNSPMGNAIRKEMFAISNQAVPNEEIGDGCVLCLSECCLGYSDTSAIYSQGNLCKKIDAMYEYSSTYPEYYLNFPSNAKTQIQLKEIKNAYYQYTCETVSKYMFAPSFYYSIYGYTNFCLLEHLGCANDYGAIYSQTIAYQIGTNTACAYWSKDSDSGSNSKGAYFTASGGRMTLNALSDQLGVRPAFVMKLG